MSYDIDVDGTDVEQDASTSFTHKQQRPRRVYAERADGSTVRTEPGDSADEVDPRGLLRPPTVNDIRWLYRETFSKKLVDKPIDDAFKHGFELQNDTIGARQLLDEHGFIDKYTLAEKKARRDGFALMFYVLADDSDGVYANPMDDDVTVQELEGINVFTLDDMARHYEGTTHEEIPLDDDDYWVRETGIVVDTRIQEPTYEEPIGYLIGPDHKHAPYDPERVTFIHANRVQHLTWNKEVDGDLEQDTLGRFEGDSILTSSFHLLQGLAKGNWSIAQTLFRYASKMYHVELPEDANEEDMDNAEENMRNMNAKSELITPHGYEIDDFQTDGQLEPEEYFSVIFEQVCAGTEMTKSVLFGTQAGTVSGSETDIKNYFNQVERYRQNRAAEQITEFVRRLRIMLDERTDQSFEPEFTFDWAPLFKLSQLDRTEELNRTMQTLSSAINDFVLTPGEARSILQEEWAEADIEWDDMTDDEVEFLETLNVAQMGTEQVLSNNEEFEGNPRVGQNGGGIESGEQTASEEPDSN